MVGQRSDSVNAIQTYISNYDEAVQDKLNAIYHLTQSLAPSATERICMGIPTFDLNGQWFIHFSANKNHIGFYPQPDAVENFAPKLTNYTCTKGSIHFPLSDPLPMDLIQEIIEYRLAHQ